MNDDQSTRIASAFAREVAGSAKASLCGACVAVLDVAGAGISILSGSHSGPVCSSNPRAERLEELQFGLNEGPCQDAFRSAAPVLVSSLGGVASARWPAFTGQAVAAGIRAVFAYPLVAGTVNVGALTIYQDHQGFLSAAQRSDAVALAALVANTLITMQAEAAPGRLPESLDDAFAHRAEVHQAAGMVAVQLQLPVADGLARIRAHAYAQGQSVGRVAADIVAGRLRLSDDGGADEGRE